MKKKSEEKRGKSFKTEGKSWQRMPKNTQEKAKRAEKKQIRQKERKKHLPITKKGNQVKRINFPVTSADPYNLSYDTSRFQ